MPLATDWRDQARCLGLPVDLFFPPFEEEDPSGQEAKRLIAEAKKVCASCSVRLECLEYALETRQEYGVWGGTTSLERKRIRRQRRRSKK